MNLHGGIALIKSTWLSWMQHRSFFFLLAFGWMIPPLIYLFVWSTAAGIATDGGATIGGLTSGEFIAYYLILVVVNQLTYAQTNWTVGDEIRYGNLSTWLLRPMAPIFNVLSTEVAGKVVYMTFTIPVALLLALLLKPEFSLTLQNALLFLPSLVFAWALRFFWGYWLALLAFWATRADALLALQDSLIFLLGGQVAPTRLLPPLIQVLSTVLPFRYMAAFPVELLTGQLNQTEIVTGFVFQTFWMLVAIGLYALMWRNGLRRYAAVGG
jgi:ABC-2 type transport system permease protein